jgi:predicted lipoprotein with Yx(FWY)xxD motif
MMAGRFLGTGLAFVAALAGSVGLTLALPATTAVAGASPPLSNVLPCSTPLVTSSTIPTGPAVVSAVPTSYGQALVVGSGTFAGCSLYMLSSDPPVNANGYGCTPGCAVFEWPALLTTGRPIAGPGVNRTLLGTVTRTIFGHQVTQVTYAGHPLYRFFIDQSAGQTTGEELFDPGTTPHGIWYLVSPGRGVPDAC